MNINVILSYGTFYNYITFAILFSGEHVYKDILFFGYTPPDVLDNVKEFEVRDDDVFIATYPKAGRFNQE